MVEKEKDRERLGGGREDSDVVGSQDFIEKLSTMTTGRGIDSETLQRDSLRGTAGNEKLFTMHGSS